MEPHQIEIRNQQRDSWNAFSPGWQKWDDYTMDFLKIQGDHIVDALDLKPNHKVLDVATGTGEPGLTMASLVDRGSVSAVDLSEKMLEIARQKASIKGLTNFDTKTADVSELPYEDSTFDAVSCRLGFMFFPDLSLAAKEIHRVLKPGGRIATTVWGNPEKNIWITAMMGTIKKNMDLPETGPDAPGIFRCARPGYVGALFAQQRTMHSEEKEITGFMHCSSTDEYWELMNDVAAPVVAALKTADEETRSRIKTEVYQLIDQNAPGEEKNLQFQARLITLVKP